MNAPVALGELPSLRAVEVSEAVRRPRKARKDPATSPWSLALLGELYTAVNRIGRMTQLQTALSQFYIAEGRGQFVPQRRAA